MPKIKSDYRRAMILESDAMPEQETYLGLCEMCTNATGCTFPRDRNKPVTACEEFSGVRPPKVKFRPPVVRRTNPSPYRGLCAYCTRVADCTYPKPDGGVWHCDEYA
jgi:hypothetical protein